MGSSSSHNRQSPPSHLQVAVTTVPSGTGTWTHPTAGSHSSTVQSLLSSEQPTVGFEQFPVEGSQTPDSWQWSNGAHETSEVPVQAPFQHVSFVHRSLSTQGVPFGLGGFEHEPVCGSHCPRSWH